MSAKLTDGQFDSYTKRGTRKITSSGTSKVVTIPSFLFKMYWKKNDMVEVYTPNLYTIVIVNENAKEREQKQKEVKTNGWIKAPHRK